MNEDREQLRRQNDEVLRAIAHAPDRVPGTVYVNLKHTQASLDERDRCLREGPLVAVKLWIALECRQRELDPIVRRAVRAMLYRLALGTGFRRKELRTLTPASFDLDADPPTVTVAAAYSKRRRWDEQPTRH